MHFAEVLQVSVLELLVVVLERWMEKWRRLESFSSESISWGAYERMCVNRSLTRGRHVGNSLLTTVCSPVSHWRCFYGMVTQEK